MKLRQVVPNLIPAKVCRCEICNSFSKCDMPAPTPSLSDIFTVTVRCFTMSSSRALQATFQSWNYLHMTGATDIYKRKRTLSIDDEKFIKYFISQVESVIIINLEREESQCQIPKMLQDGIDNKVKAIDNLKSEHEKNIKRKRKGTQQCNCCCFGKGAKSLAMNELRELNSNNLKSFSMREQKLQMKINMQDFLMESS